VINPHEPKKMIMKKMIFRLSIKLSVCVSLILATSLVAHAQLLDPEEYNDPYGLNINEDRNNQLNSGTPDPEDPTGVPVDGGLGFLLAAGVGYGANKLRKYRKDKKAV
jgi:hypothetical protein